MSSLEAKAELQDYLQGAQETLVGKLEGLSDYDIRSPMTPSGTNLLGLVKHSTATHVGYFGEVFERSSAGLGERFVVGASPADEFWASAQESSSEIVNRLPGVHGSSPTQPSTG